MKIFFAPGSTAMQEHWKRSSNVITPLYSLISIVPWLLLGLLALAEHNGQSVARLFFSLPQDTLSLSYHLATIVLSLLLLIALTTFAPKWQRFCAF